MKKTIIVISIFFLIAVSGMFGQSYRTFASEIRWITENARWKIGPFRIYPRIQFRNIGYDDNVYYQIEERGPISDYTATFSPEIRTYLLFRNYLILSFSENPEYVYYVKQSRERRWNNSLSPSFKLLLLSRFVLGGGYSYSNRRRRATSEFDVRANVHREVYNGNLFYETARGTSFGFTVSSGRISFEDITMPGEEIYLSRMLNRKEQNANFEFYYRIFSETFFFLRGGYTEYNFEDVDYQWRNSYSYQSYAGVRFPLLGNVRGTISLGYKKLIPRSEERQGFSGLVGNTSVEYRVWRFGFRGQYIRDCPFSYWTNSVYYISDNYVGGISFYLTRFLRIDYSYNYGEGRYPEPMMTLMPDGSYEETKRKDVYRTHIVGFVFRVVRNTGIGINVSWWSRDSNYYWANRDRMFIGGYLTYDF